MLKNTGESHRTDTQNGERGFCKAITGNYGEIPPKELVANVHEGELYLVQYPYPKGKSLR